MILPKYVSIKEVHNVCKCRTTALTYYTNEIMSVLTTLIYFVVLGLTIYSIFIEFKIIYKLKKFICSFASICKKSEDNDYIIKNL